MSNSSIRISVKNESASLAKKSGIGGRGKGKKIRYARHRRQIRGHIYGISSGDIRRLARRGGVKRISGLIYDEARQVLRLFLESVLKDSVLYAEHAQRKTVLALDVLYALKRRGKVLYGFETK